jgi:hypothetical protein
MISVLGCEGPVGPSGPAGSAGNANVVSGSFSVAPGDWTNDFWYFPVDGGTQGNPAKVATVAVAAISAAIVSDGAVLVYLKVPETSTGASTHWTLLPFHQIGSGGGYLVSLKAAAKEGEILLGYLHEPTDASVVIPETYSATLPTYEFRYVAMAGVPAAAVASYARFPDPDQVLVALRRHDR